MQPRTPAEPDPEAQTPPSERLRVLVPVEHKDRWPICVRPTPDETPRSWLVRTSHRYGLTPRTFLTAMGLPGGPPRVDLEANLVTEADAIAAVLGTRPPPSRSTIKLDDDRLTGVLPRDNSGMFCPTCLTEGTGWSALWRTSWVVTCPTHRLMLVPCCPYCGQRPWSSRAWGTHYADAVHCTERLPPPTHATRRVVRSWCDGDLGDAPCVAAPVEVVDAQQTLYDLTREAHESPEKLMELGPWTVTAFQRSRTFAVLIWLSMQQTSGEVSTSEHLARAGTAFAELSGRDGSGPTVASMLGDHQTTGLLGPKSKAVHCDLGPVLVAAGLRQIAPRLSPGSRLAFRTVRTWSAHPVDWTAVRDHGRDILPEHQTEPLTPPMQWIPQTFWPSILEAEGFKDTDGAVLAMIFARMGRSVPWSHVALELGLPSALQHAAGTRLRHFHRRRWPGILAAMEELFAQLRAAPPPVNYSARRRVTHNVKAFVTILEADLDTDLPSVRRFWENFTGGDIRLAPELLRAPAGSRDFNCYRALREQLDEQHADLFRAHQARLLIHHGATVDGPLRWEPP